MVNVICAAIMTLLWVEGPIVTDYMSENVDCVDVVKNWEDSNGIDAYGGIHRGDNDQNQEEDGGDHLQPRPRGE